MAETGSSGHSGEEAGQRRRIAWLLVVLLGLGLLVAGRLADWQLTPHPEIEQYDPQTVEYRQEEGGLAAVLPAIRGNILDATRGYLAVSTVECEVFVMPPDLTEKERTELPSELAAIVGGTEESIAAILNRPERQRFSLGDGLPVEVSEQVEDLECAGLSVAFRYPRVYPDGELATFILGFVDYEGGGQYGLEQFYDRELRGVDGQWFGILDPAGRPFLATLGGYRPAQDGADLVLALDRNIQHEARRILWEGIRNNKASSGNVIVLDSRTGGLLAMANYPTYSPGAYWEVESLDEFINRSIGAVYEPGSVFKPFTLAAALDAQVIRPTDTYDDRGIIIVGQQEIRNSDRKAHGITTMTELLAYSLNVGAAHVATLLGPTRFYDVIRRFGFAEATGIDLEHEERGIMRMPGQPAWHMSDLGTNSYGQGISVTPLQVVMAYGALANGGVLMKPYSVSALWHQDRVETKKPMRVRQVISPEAAEQITQLMVDSVELGMKPAVVPGYSLAGKSGTAGIPDLEGYNSQDVVASFVGFGPVPDPRFVILVKFDKPREGTWGVEVAAPEFSRMAKFLLDYYGIPPIR